VASTIVDYVVVALLGVSVAVGELVTRYRDAPSQSLRSGPAGLYMALNAGASLAALALVHVFGWNFGVSSSNPEAVRWTQVLAAGFGAMTLFRSSLFIAKVGGQDFGIGPGGVLQSLLGAADRGVDRSRGSRRDAAVKKISGISFTKAHGSLPAYCLQLMQNVSSDDAKRLGDQVALLANDPDMPEATKARVLCLLLMNVVGEDVVLKAVETLKPEIGLDDAPARTVAKPKAKPHSSQP
jgi:hypothetical protein